MAQPGESKESNQNAGGDSIPSDGGNDPTATTTLPAATTTTVNPHDQEDRDFDPTAEALVDEIDDERTLEEEEALAGNNATAVQNELEDLRKESEMPIEELLAYYQRMRDEEARGGEEAEEEEEMDDEDEDGELDDDDDDDENVTEVRKQSSKATNSRTNSDNLNHFNNDLHQKSTRNQQSQQPQSHHEHTSAQTQSIDIPLSNPPTNLSNRQHQSPSDISRSDARAQSDTRISGSSLDQMHDEQHHNDQHAETRPLNECSVSLRVHKPDQESYPVAVSSTSRLKHSMTEFLIGNGPHVDGMFKTLLDYDLDDSDDFDEDYSFTDDEDDEREWRRSIHVGPDHQADVPESLSMYEGDLLPYESEDKLVWCCNPNMNLDKILEYLKQAATIPKRNDISISPSSVPRISDDILRLYHERLPGQISASELHPVERNCENVIGDNLPENLRDVYMSQSRKRARIDYELERENTMDGLNQLSDDVQVGQQLPTSLGEDNSTMTSSQGARHELSTEEYFQDEEQLLYLLLQCNHNIEEALRRRRLDPFKYYINEPMSLWSQDECLGFEHGLKLYGKDFRLIRENKVPTRTRAEVVSFYYLWKKSERHDVYTNQYKLDRKKCLSHPGTTDYMDKFIEDNESVLNASTTPTPTPTESTAEIPDTSYRYNSSAMSLSLSHPSNIKQMSQQQLSQHVAPIQCLNLQGSIAVSKTNYDILQPPTTDDENNLNSSSYVDNNTSL